MRASKTLLKHVPLIRFVGGPHKLSAHPGQPHPMAPEGLAPSSASSSFSSKPIEAGEGEYFSRSQLPKRFQYRLPSEAESENIITGGAEVIF